MPETTEYGMARGRALITEAEREHIAGQRGNEQRKYEAVSRVRGRVRDELTKDIELLEEHNPDLLEDIRGVVCPDHSGKGGEGGGDDGG